MQSIERTSAKPPKHADNPRSKGVRGLLLAGQIGLVGGLLVCFVLRPGIIAGPKGFSNYGVLVRTIVPYTLAFLVAAACTVLAARGLESTEPQVARLRQGLYLLAILYTTVLLSTYPYHSTPVLRSLHLAAGTTLFAWQVLFAAWLVRSAGRDWPNDGLFTLLLIGSLLSLLSLTGFAHSLARGQALTIVAFGLILLRSSARIATGPKTA